MVAASSSERILALRPSPRRGIRLAVNYSAAAAHLVQTGRADIDLFKCPDRVSLLREARRQRPVYVHFPLYAGRRMGGITDLDAVAERLAQTGTPYVNAYLDPQVMPQAGLVSGMFDAIQRTVRDVEGLVARFGAARVVVENVPYYKECSMHESLAAEPALIRQVVEETGCGLQLNLAHARRAARSMAMDERRYLSLLPVAALRVLHVTGMPSHAGQARDPRPMTDADWNLFDWVADRMLEGTWGFPSVLALDYGGVGGWFAARTDEAVLACQIACLDQAARRLAEETAPTTRSRGYVPAHREADGGGGT